MPLNEQHAKTLAAIERTRRPSEYARGALAALRLERAGATPEEVARIDRQIERSGSGSERTTIGSDEWRP